MRMIWNKGHRIRASDKHLVYHFSIGTLLFVFVAVLLLLNMKQLMRTDWKHFSLLENGLTLSPYNFITILIATGVCALVAFLYYRFCYDSFKKLLHRQKLARMILYICRNVITVYPDCKSMIDVARQKLMNDPTFKHLSEDCQEYYFDFEAYASHLQEHGKFLVTEHGIFELPE